MNDNFKNSLFYPEFFTHQSIRLANPPVASDIPNTGYMYVWYTYIDEKMYMNIKLDDGSTKNCPMFEQIKSEIEITSPSELEPTVFSASDISNSIISNRDILVINNSYAIAQVYVYTTSLQQEKIEISCPIYFNGTSTYIDFTSVDSNFLQYGGEIVYAQGMYVDYGVESNPYIIPSVQGSVNIDANNGLYQSIRSITNELVITTSSINNLEDNKTLKIYINNDSEANVLIGNEVIPYQRFFVLFGSFEGIVYQIGKPVKISN